MKTTLVWQLLCAVTAALIALHPSCCSAKSSRSHALNRLWPAPKPAARSGRHHSAVAQRGLPGGLLHHVRLQLLLKAHFFLSRYSASIASFRSAPMRTSPHRPPLQSAPPAATPAPQVAVEHRPLVQQPQVPSLRLHAHGQPGHSHAGAAGVGQRAGLHSVPPAGRCSPVAACSCNQPHTASETCLQLPSVHWCRSACVAWASPSSSCASWCTPLVRGADGVVLHRGQPFVTGCLSAWPQWLALLYWLACVWMDDSSVPRPNAMRAVKLSTCSSYIISVSDNQVASLLILIESS